MKKLSTILIVSFLIVSVIFVIPIMIADTNKPMLTIDRYDPVYEKPYYLIYNQDTSHYYDTVIFTEEDSILSYY